MPETPYPFPPEIETRKNDLEAQLLQFYYLAEPFQEPNLPYHNWEHHVRTAYQQARQLCDRYEENRRPDEPSVNRLVVGLAILGHDSGYSHYDSVEELQADTGFTSREAYSVHITTNLLESCGYDQEIIDQVNVCIMGTQLGADCPTVESKIVRRADLFNIASNYEYFRRNTMAFREEINMIRQRKGDSELGLKEFAQISSMILGEYLRDDFKLGDWDTHPFNHSVFFVDATMNILELLRECGLVLSGPLREMANRLLNNKETNN